jgi:hypothetical protein
MKKSLNGNISVRMGVLNCFEWLTLVNWHLITVLIGS